MCRCASAYRNCSDTSVEDACDSCFLLVADSDNDRVKLLTAGAALEWVRDVLGPAGGDQGGLCGPYRLGVDEAQTLLAVGCVDGRVFVYRVRDLLPDSVDAPSACALSRNCSAKRLV